MISIWIIIWFVMILRYDSFLWFCLLEGYRTYFISYWGLFLPLYILLRSSSYPFISYWGLLLPLYILLRSSLTPLYLIDILHHLPYRNGPFAERSDINRHRFVLPNNFLFVTWLKILSIYCLIENFLPINWVVRIYWIPYILVCFAK